MNFEYRFLTKLLAFFCLTWIPISNASSLPENHAVNGGLTIIPIDAAEKPEVFFDKHRIAVAKSPNPNQWLLIVGLPLENTQSVRELEMQKPHSAKIPFYISDKFYKTQYLTIEDKRKVEPLPEDQKRIDEENKKLAEIFSHYSLANPFAQEFKAPANGPISSFFGLKRVYNKQPRPPHVGLDIAAPADSPVHVISRGTVVDADDYFYTGNTVIVDHGMGIFSLYAHLNKMNVKKGDTVEQGAAVGTIGMTGRATGPHLHWSIVMNQTYIDPLLFVPLRKISIASSPPKKSNKAPAKNEINAEASKEKSS
ncbi:peptidoglycan DD-metalloendopeptidase family protein [Legionella sp. 27cVA30]|uniref:M23 family metallopeptidase n=1 Tax=Legionella septentrionalis TaxID=2498109 RepID=A0A3S0X3L3_9GAMM|nr:MULTISPECIES: M23 family metallopeptidase [Legionella]MCP0912950.1 peptidoglycan DD-metalloendopeptidase family protein [Legionella sp. 27cVA30]RUQ84519.1 M23 family metallopeptidase [Legionella septentrionalis]